MVSVGGVVRSFSPEKQYGFIQGEDGQSYYVHQRDVTGGVSLVVQQFVTFDPVPTPKGMRAKKVVPGPQPVLVHRDPDRFIITRSRTVRGCIIVKVVSQHNWAESRDPNQARGLLQTIAVRAGANAIVNLELVVHHRRFAGYPPIGYAKRIALTGGSHAQTISCDLD